MRLVPDPTSADLIVDLSNVCSRKILGGSDDAALPRLEVAAGLFAAMAGEPDPRVFAVADTSLTPRLKARPDDKRLLRQWIGEGLVEELDGADERILTLVELTGVHAMSWDRYIGHRDDYPWVQGDNEHFVWVVSSPRGPVCELRDMETVSAELISRSAEVDALKAAHLLDGRGRPDASVFKTWWRCPDRRCSLFGSDVSRGQPVPYRLRNTLMCSLHRQPLESAGDRPAQVLVTIVAPDGTTAGRFTVIHGQTVTVGRGAQDGVDVQAALHGEDLSLISRAHVQLSVDGGWLKATDPGSSNGSEISDGRPGLRPLPREQWTVVEPAGFVQLPGGARLRISGRRFPTMTSRPPKGPAAVRDIPTSLRAYGS